MGRTACCRPSILPIYSERNRVKTEGFILKKLAAGLIVGCALLATGVAGATTGRAGGASRAATVPPIVWGVADDASKFADDGGDCSTGGLRGANHSETLYARAGLSPAPTHPTA